MTTAERIRVAISQARAPLVVSGWRGVTVSIGVATLPVHAGDAADLVSNADQALYEAKRRGKDTVVVFGAA